VSTPRPVATGLVLAAGGSQRLGRPKQLLPYGSGTLLDHVLDTARACRFDQLLCVIGGGADEVRARVRLDGVEVVVNPEFGEGCSSSIAAALNAVDARCEVLVLMLGDQPGVTAATVASLLAGRGEAPIAACGYANGRGHPLAFSRDVFGEGNRRSRGRSDPARRRHVGGLRGGGPGGRRVGARDARLRHWRQSTESRFYCPIPVFHTNT
jgi:molybdenum cofactor cytidylyltransferase